MVLTLDEYQNGQTLAPSGATLMSDEEVLNDVRDFFGRNVEYVEKCNLDEEARATMTKNFMELHQFYYQGSKTSWGNHPREGVQQFGPPRPWTGQDIVNCVEACGLGSNLRKTLVDEEIYVEDKLKQESPVTWLDTEDLVDLLGEDLQGDAAIFLLAVNYIKGSNRSSSRKA